MEVYCIMDEYIRMNCICCNKIVEVYVNENPLAISPAYYGLIFRSTGNFGSKVLDSTPVGGGEILQVVICDDCMKKKAKRVTRIYNIKLETTAECGEFHPLSRQ